MKELTKRFTTFALLCVMVLSMGVVVFGYANKRTLFVNYTLLDGYGMRSEDLKCNAAGTCPSTVSWKNVKANGNFLNNVFMKKKILGIFDGYGYVSQKTGRITSTTSMQTFQVKWQSNSTYQFELIGSNGVNATIASYVVYYN